VTLKITRKPQKFIIVVLIILFTPLGIARYKDGGTTTYTALSYKLIVGYQLDGTLVDIKQE
jgi:hypothetical protein